MMEKPAHILILDDDEGILQLARRLLERVGHRVTTASNAAEAERVMRAAERPDLLVLDYRLGAAATGLDFFRQMRGEGSTVPAILVTGFTDEGKIIEALRAGIADVVPKAGDYLEYLPEAVSRVLTQARMAEQVAEAELIKEREGYYRTLAEVLPQLVWTCLPDGSCDFLSKQWVEYTGVPEKEQLGLAWLDRVMHPEDLREPTKPGWPRWRGGRITTWNIGCGGMMANTGGSRRAGWRCAIEREKQSNGSGPARTFTISGRRWRSAKSCFQPSSERDAKPRKRIARRINFWRCCRMSCARR